MRGRLAARPAWVAKEQKKTAVVTTCVTRPPPAFKLFVGMFFGPHRQESVLPPTLQPFAAAHSRLSGDSGGRAPSGFDWLPEASNII